MAARVLRFSELGAASPTAATCDGTDRSGWTAGVCGRVHARSPRSSARYTGFAVGSTSPVLLAAGFALAGAGIGLAETAESTVVAQLLPDELRGSGFGVLGAVQSVGALAASSVVGLLYALATPVIAFGYAAAWMVGSLLATGALRTPGRSA